MYLKQGDGIFVSPSIPDIAGNEALGLELGIDAVDFTSFEAMVFKAVSFFSNFASYTTVLVALGFALNWPTARGEGLASGSAESGSGTGTEMRPDSTFECNSLMGLIIAAGSSIKPFLNDCILESVVVAVTTLAPGEFITALESAFSPLPMAPALKIAAAGTDWLTGGPFVEETCVAIAVAAFASATRGRSMVVTAIGDKAATEDNLLGLPIGATVDIALWPVSTRGMADPGSFESPGCAAEVANSAFSSALLPFAKALRSSDSPLLSATIASLPRAP